MNDSIKIHDNSFELKFNAIVTDVCPKYDKHLKTSGVLLALHSDTDYMLLTKEPLFVSDELIEVEHDDLKFHAKFKSETAFKEHFFKETNVHINIIEMVD